MRSRRLALCLACALIAPALLPATASASGGETGPGAAVTGECIVQMIPSGSLDPEFSIVGYAAAAPTKEVVVATGVSCEVYDANTGYVYTSSSRFLSGPASATESSAWLPLAGNLVLRWCGTVLYASGRTEIVCGPY